jgi:hypothetical protein
MLSLSLVTPVVFCNVIWNYVASQPQVKINLIKIVSYDCGVRRFSLKVWGDTAIKTRSQSGDSCCYKVLGAAHKFFVAPDIFQVDSRWELLIHIYCS